MDGEPRSLDGALVEATGILSRRSVPAPASVWDSDTGPYGTFFVLQDQQDPARMARVRLVRPNKTQQPTGAPSGAGG